MNQSTSDEGDCASAQAAPSAPITATKNANGPINWSFAKRVIGAPPKRLCYFVRQKISRRRRSRHRHQAVAVSDAVPFWIPLGTRTKSAETLTRIGNAHRAPAKYTVSSQAKVFSLVS